MRRLAACATMMVVGASIAHAAPPKSCDASVVLPKVTDGAPHEAHITGAVKAITPTKAGAPHFAVVIADATSGDFAFDLYIATSQLPFKVGDKVDARLRRGGGWHQVFDALIKDGSGKTLLVASGSGADDWADGWKVTPGKIVESRQDPNQKQQSVNRTHALDFARGSAKATTLPSQCAVVTDNGETYLVAGFASSWLGVRPPEGVDYQTFSLIRQ